MRIAYMLTSLGIGGAERQAVALAERMMARGHDVVLIVLRPRLRHEWPTRLPVIRLDMTKSPGRLAAGLIRGRRFLSSFQPHILHSHTFPANMAARLFRAVGAASAVVSTIHNVYEGGRRRTLAYRLTDRFCTCSTAVSQAVADRYIEIGAVPPEKGSVITNGIDLDEFSPSRQGSHTRECATHAEDGFIWLAAGRDVPAKDFDNLLTAFRRVRARRPETQLRVAGEPGKRRRIRILGSALGSELYELPGIHWLGHCEDMAATIAAVDGFVLSSAWEGLPLVVGEAMAMERPVVATDVGGVRELVGDAGAVVPKKDPQALADAMLRVMRLTEEERRAMGRSGRLRIRQHFDMNAKAAAWDALYARLLGDAR
jgi:glycosyltransferase involved in cell wall biosynthesis